MPEAGWLRLSRTTPARDLVAEGVEAIVTETVEAVRSLDNKSGEKGYTINKAVAEKLGIDKAAAWRRVRIAINRGYLENPEDRRGRPAQRTVGEAVPEDREILPSPERLREAMSGCTVAPDLEGAEHPPPPSWTGSIGPGGDAGDITSLKQPQPINREHYPARRSG